MNILEKIDRYLTEADNWIVKYRAKDKSGKVLDKEMKVKATSKEAAMGIAKRKSSNWYEGVMAKLDESYGKGLDSQYLQNSIGLVIDDIKRDPDEKHMVKVLKFVKDRLNQSFPDGDITQEDIANILREPNSRGIMKKAGTSYMEIIEYIWQD